MIVFSYASGQKLMASSSNTGWIHEYIICFCLCLCGMYAYVLESVNAVILWQGFIGGAVINIYLTGKLGFGKVSTGALRSEHSRINFNTF